jgi:hypothetical protein
MATPPTEGGFLIQSSFGTKGNFEVVVPRRAGGLAHYWRDNDAAGLPWHAPADFGGGSLSGAALIQSSFGGNLEVVAVEGNRLVHYWREGNEWHPSTHFGGGVSGTPALIQSSFGKRGNFEVVVPRQAGGLAHYWRDNDSPDLPWSGPTDFGEGSVSAAALIQSNFDGNLEVVALEPGSWFPPRSSRLVHYWREGNEWHPSTHFGGGVSGTPALIQSSFGNRGNFEVVVPRQAGGLAHHWRDNDSPDLPWSGPTDFGEGSVSAAALIQSNFDGNLEVVALEPGSWLPWSRTRLAHYWRSDTWSGSYYVPDEAVWVHVKVLRNQTPTQTIVTTPNIPINQMLAAMREVYASAGFMVEEASTETIDVAATLLDIDVGSCVMGTTTTEQDTLFQNRSFVAGNNVVAYFVRSTVPPLNGCASHPSGSPGAIVTQGATQWTLGHEIGHVLGLSHVNDNDRLMTGNGTANITNPPPDLVASEVDTMRASASTEPV